MHLKTVTETTQIIQTSPLHNVRIADCVVVKFELLNCDLCCFISTTTMSPLHCSLYKLNSFFLQKITLCYAVLHH